MFRLISFNLSLGLSIKEMKIVCVGSSQKVDEPMARIANQQDECKAWLVPEVLVLDFQQTYGNPDNLFEDTSGISS